jgi:hypothetical protein
LGKIGRDACLKPCKACLKAYGGFLCSDLGHCAFEGSGEWPEEAKPTTQDRNDLILKVKT